ncbi:MAG: extracellular solute-binding protein [Oscillospiraceae bacterium]|nr:extracellular solute-binding protein [Oscillospiraceae bacterium]
MKKTLSFILAALMLLALAAGCASDSPSGNGGGNTDPSTDPGGSNTDPNTNGGTSDPADELVTLQLFSMASNDSGLQDRSYWAEILKEDLNIQLEMLPAGDDAADKLLALMASGSLPDIVVFKDDLTYLTDAIEANFLINLDEHLDKLPNVTANADGALQFIRDFASRDTGNAYAVPLGVSNQYNKMGSVVGPYVRWDLYKELNSPKLADIEDYIPLLKQMVDLEPTTPEGQRTYGISLFSDWDGVVPWQVRILCEMYGVTQDGLASIEYNVNTGTLTSIFDDSSYFKRILKFLFDANQEGILDPDIVTNSWGDYWDKASAGRMMFSYFDWTVGTYDTTEKKEAGNTYKGVFFDNQRKIINAPPYVGGDGGSWWIAVSSSTQNLDKALAYVNYMFDHDGLWRLAWGEQGIAWDLGSDGKPYRTPLGWEMRNDSLPFANGGLIAEGINIPATRGLTWSTIHPKFGARMDELDWTRGSGAPEEFAVDVEWRTVMNALDDIDYGYKNGLIAEKPFILPMAPMPDEVKAIADQVEAESKAYVYRIILANNEETFNSLWDELVTRTAGMGVATVEDWVRDSFNTAKNQGSQYAR